MPFDSLFKCHSLKKKIATAGNKLILQVMLLCYYVHSTFLQYNTIYHLNSACYFTELFPELPILKAEPRLSGPPLTGPSVIQLSGLQIYVTSPSYHACTRAITQAR